MRGLLTFNIVPVFYRPGLSAGSMSGTARHGGDHRRPTALAPALRRAQPAMFPRGSTAEVACDLPNLAPGTASLLDVTVGGCRQGTDCRACSNRRNDR